MDRAEVKEGILCLLEDSLGRTFEEIQEFLKANKVREYSEEAASSTLKKLLAEMREEGLIEQRFMADGADTVDFAIEEGGLELLKSLDGTRKKWNTGRPDISESEHQMMKNMEDME